MGVDIPPQQRTKGSRQGAQEPGHPPKVAGQAVQVSGQRDQLYLQSSGAEGVVLSRINQPPLVPFRDDPQDEASWPGGKTAVVVGTVTDDERIQEVPKLKEPPTPTTPPSHTKPNEQSKYWKFERTKGRPASRGYKN
ncbi:60S ribosomal protein L18 [Myotis davidii]|uniref:60S ribosomal protein L18 n=1 Tax=Myotis davidii TaxID=225400 RepID=L5LC44_MYODS|nr:60S ribosomal protein L18 [Myotis davidii]